MEELKQLFSGKGYIDGITILDLQGEILFSAKFNAKFSDLDESQQLVGKRFLDVYENLTPETSTLYQAMESGGPIYQERQYLKRRDKQGIYITALSLPIRSNGRIVGAIDLSTQHSEPNSNGMDGDKIELKKEALQRNLTHKLSKDHHAFFEYDDIIAVSDTMRQAKEYLKIVAACDLPVLIYGETGTGKEVFAQAIHNLSERRDRPFIAQNCAAIPETLLESLLFGTEKGAFTGAVERKGLLELADGGTLLLDELNSMPLYLQSKLLRVLQDGSFLPLGSVSPKRCNVKIIAALNQDPTQAISDGHLRQDVYYRLGMMSIFIPPLWERREDIRYFAETYVQKHNATFQKHIRYISKDLLNKLTKYHWPGNVRELEHIIVYGMSMVDQDSDTLQFPDIEKEFNFLIQKDSETSVQHGKYASLEESVSAYERSLILDALNTTGGNISEAAKLMNIPRQTLQRKVKQYDIHPKEPLIKSALP